MFDLETQLAAVIGFSVWLAEQPASEVNESLISVLETYRLEVERQISKQPASDEWYVALKLTVTHARLTLDGLLETFPALKTYVPTDEPQNTTEMAARLLVDAISLFEATCEGLNIDLDISSAVDEINSMIERVVDAGMQR